MIRAREHIAAMDPYALAALRVPEGKRLISLSQNESAFPPSPRAIDAARGAMGESWLYPDPDWKTLRQAISDVHDVCAEQVLCGAGSMELIDAIVRAYSGTGTEVLASEHSYAFFRTAALACGAQYCAAPETDRCVSVDALLANVSSKTRLVFVANPGNPTATRIPRAELIRLRQDLPANVLLLVDEAYGEFADRPGEAMWDLVERGDTVVIRTFSKAYGLAGMRVGWGLFPPTISVELRKLLNPNNISGPAQAAAAAAMLDQGYMKMVVAKTADRRVKFVEDLQARGFNAYDSFTNFVLIDLEGPQAATSAASALQKEGIILRTMGGYGLGNCLRATIGAEEDMVLTVKTLNRWRTS